MSNTVDFNDFLLDNFNILAIDSYAKVYSPEFSVFMYESMLDNVQSVLNLIHKLPKDERMSKVRDLYHNCRIDGSIDRHSVITSLFLRSFYDEIKDKPMSIAWLNVLPVEYEKSFFNIENAVPLEEMMSSTVFYGDKIQEELISGNEIAEKGLVSPLKTATKTKLSEGFLVNHTRMEYINLQKYCYILSTLKGAVNLNPLPILTAVGPNTLSRMKKINNYILFDEKKVGLWAYNYISFSENYPGHKYTQIGNYADYIFSENLNEG